MPLFLLINILGFGFGTALTLILLSLSLKKYPKHFSDFSFGIVLFACLLWHGGNFISLLMTLLFGTFTTLVANLAMLFAYLGMAALPSVLIHEHLATFYSIKHPKLVALERKHYLLFALPYLPFLLIIISGLSHFTADFSISQNFINRIRIPFDLWLLIALLFSVFLSNKLYHLLSEKADQHFYRDIAYILGAVAAGLVFIYIIPIYRLAYIGPYFNLLMNLAPSYPMALLAYYVYRYNFYRLVIKPSLIYSLIYGIVMGVYLLGIRRLGEYLKQFPEINSEFIEGLLLIALVFAFQPFRNQLQIRLDKVFFKDRYYYQQFLRELSDTISSIVELETLLFTIKDAMMTTLKARYCTLIVFLDTEHGTEIYKSVGNKDVYALSDIVNALVATQHFRLRRQMRDRRVVSALRKNGFEIAIPVYSNEKFTGLICLSEKQTGNAYSDEEFDMLQTFANQVGLAFTNTLLIQERIDLEGRIYESEKLNTLGAACYDNGA